MTNFEEIKIEYIENSYLNTYSLKSDLIMNDTNTISKNEIFFEIDTDDDSVLLTNSDEKDTKVIFWAHKSEINFLNKKKVRKLAANFKIE